TRENAAEFEFCRADHGADGVFRIFGAGNLDADAIRALLYDDGLGYTETVHAVADGADGAFDGFGHVLPKLGFVNLKLQRDVWLKGAGRIAEQRATLGQFG